MAFSIGRVGLSTPSLSMPTSLRFDGDSTQMAGIFRSTSAAQAIVVRDQIRGLVGNVDEPVVPVFFDSTYATHNGLYRIDAASVDVQPGDGAQWICRWQVTATRVTTYQSPVLESRIVVGLLTNAHGVASSTARCEFGAVSPVTEVAPNSTTYLDVVDTLTSADGPVDVLAYKPAAFTTGQGTLRYSVTLADWYDGGCKITAAGDTVVGRQVVDSPTSWSMTNGLVTVSASASVGELDVSHYDGSAYDTAKTFKINGSTTAGDVNGFHHMAVLRNGPEATTVRLGLKNPGGQTANADVTIRRGSRWVQVLITSAIVDTWGIKRSSTEAATALTGGIRATSNDASGNRFLLAIPVATTNDLVNGGVRLTSAALRALVGIGSEVAGSSASGSFTAQNQIYRFLGATYETVNVVGR